MAKTGLKFNQRDINNLKEEISNAVEDAMADTYKFYVKETPKRGGNARRNTKYKKSSDRFKITSNYDYAEKLDSGWSRQSPNGFTDPSFDYLEKQIDRNFKRI